MRNRLLRFLPLAVPVLALLLYGKAAITNDLVYDDTERAVLLGSEPVEEPAPLTDVLLHWQEEIFPAAKGGDGFQWLAAILAALVGCGVFLVYRRLFGIGPALAAWAAGIFIVHPAVASAVFVSLRGQGVLWALFLATAALLCWIRAGVVWGTAAAILAGLAALCHPQALVVLLFLPLLAEHPPAAEEGRNPWPRRAVVGMVLAAVLAVWWNLRGVPALTWLQDLTAPARSMAYALTTALIPSWGAIPEPTFGSWWSGGGWIRLIFAAALALLLLIGFRSAGGKFTNPLGLAGIWFLATLLPVMQIFGQQSLYAERYLALPLVGLVALVALTVQRLPDRAAGWVSRWPLLAVVLALLIAISADRSSSYADGETFHRRWVESSPDSAPAHKGLALALARQGKGAEALTELRRAVALAPENGRLQGTLGDLLRAQGNLQGAAEAYQAGMAAAPEDATLPFRQGELFLAAGQPEAAAEALRKAAELEREDPAPRLRLAEALARQGKAEEAIALFDGMLAEVAEEPERQSALQVDYGNLLADLGRGEEALAAYRRALELDPQRAEAHFNLGLAHLGAGRTGEALGSFRQALAVRPDYAEAHTNLGVVLAGQGELEEALEHARKAVEIAPETGSYHFNLGTTLLLAGETEEGLQTLRQGLTVAPNNPDGHLLLGQTLMERGRFADSAASFENALRLRGDWVDAMIPLSWILATASDDTLRDGEMAVRLAERATHLTQYRDLDALNALAAAYAEVGQFDRAGQVTEEVVRRLEANGQGEAAEGLKRILDLYRQGQPVRSGG